MSAASHTCCTSSGSQLASYGGGASEARAKGLFEFGVGVGGVVGAAAVGVGGVLGAKRGVEVALGGVMGGRGVEGSSVLTSTCEVEARGSTSASTAKSSRPMGAFSLTSSSFSWR